ncbi:hypothetical protein KSP40_PGU010748 [Platanthera guangdongensis]|uniref:Uncharacterized protein n=1 Tax=Platanthera guangdongensis TaxID=2320717 RepID=A0ABR2LJW9_9ASPA
MEVREEAVVSLVREMLGTADGAVRKAAGKIGPFYHDEKNLQIIYPWLLLLPPGEHHISVPWHLPKLTLGLDLEVTLEDGNKLNDGDGRGVAEVEKTKLGGPVLCSAEAGAFLCRVQERKIPWKTKLRQRATTIEAHRRQKLQKLGTRK